ncbi:FAD-dependent oxidoreductase [Limibacillus sp. MBR-115]|jgi:ferredoxin--NADP+ reductase|uniref:FAD-dependent oxidoreductase n=1 Tax=Limibacillus sp. MBR-115 TaxID=3156465 RepID=UPI0033923995
MNRSVDTSNSPIEERLVGANGSDASPRVAVVGAGPAGLYAAQSLLESDSELKVDVFDRLPTPYGLVRYGIAPDNQQMKSVTRVLRTVFDYEKRVRFFGNVCFGADLSRADMLEHYDAVIYATGAQRERRLDIPGEDLPGSYSAKMFVDWYNGHPDAADHDFLLNAKQVAVIGAGNVALDVARMLLRSPDEVASTDVPVRVLNAFSNSLITDVYLIARRGPAQAKFTPVELREIGKLANVDIILRPSEVLLSDEDENRISLNRQLQTNVKMLRDWAQRPSQGKARRIHFRFLRRPERILGENRVDRVLLESNELLDDGRVRGTGNQETLDVGMIFSTVGFQATPLPDVPFDESRSIIPNSRGRVIGENSQFTEGEYVTGWAKRGPSGTVGNNRSDSSETVCSLLADLAARKSHKGSDPKRILTLLDSRGVGYTNWANWLRLDDHELHLGRKQNRPRVKIPDLRTMLKISRLSNDSGSTGGTN